MQAGCDSVGVSSSSGHLIDSVGSAIGKFARALSLSFPLCISPLLSNRLSWHVSATIEARGQDQDKDKEGRTSAFPPKKKTKTCPCVFGRVRMLVLFI